MSDTNRKSVAISQQDSPLQLAFNPYSGMVLVSGVTITLLGLYFAGQLGGSGSSNGLAQVNALSGALNYVTELSQLPDDKKSGVSSDTASEAFIFAKVMRNIADSINSSDDSLDLNKFTDSLKKDIDGAKARKSEENLGDCGSLVSGDLLAKIQSFMKGTGINGKAFKENCEKVEKIDKIMTNYDIDGIADRLAKKFKPSS